MEPVELKIITRNQTKAGLEEIVRDTTKVGRTVEQVTADFKARMKEQSEVVKQVEADIKALEKQLGKASPGKAKMELVSELETAKKVLAEEKGALIDLEKQVEQSSQKHIALRTQIRNLKEEMAGMTEGTQEYREAMEQLGALQDQYGDIGTQGRIFSDDNKNIKAAMDAVSGLSGAMTAGVGVASLFGMEQEKLEKIQTRLQAVMAITMGVQQVANTLNKDSYFTHVLLAGAKNMLTGATVRLAAALGISNVAAKALMATLTLGLSVVITGLIWLWNEYSAKTVKEQQKITDEIDNTRAAMNSLANDTDFDVRIAEAAGKSRRELIELQREAAKTALALADLNFDKIQVAYTNGNATKEQLEEARKVSQEAWEALMKVNQDATVQTIKDLEDEKQKGKQRDEGNLNKAREIADAELKAQQKINEMTIALMEEGEQKKKALARKQFDEELTRIDHEEQERLAALKNAQKNGMAVSPGQVATVQDQAKKQRDMAGELYIKEFFAVEKEYSEKSEKLKEEERQAWIEYNKEYGTCLEKRAAITQDYENRIAKAGNEGEKAILRKKLEEVYKNLDLENLKKEIDWSSVFGNLDKVSTDALGRLKMQLQEFMKAQKNLSPENIKEIVQAINSIENEEKQRTPFQALSDSFASLTKASKELTEARRAYNDVLAAGTEKEIADARAKLDSAEAARRQAQTESTASLQAGASKMREYAQVVDGVLGVMEELGIKTPEWLSGYLDGVNGVLDGLAQIDLTKPMTIITGGLQTIKGAIKSIVSLGGTIRLFNGADYSEYNELVAKYDVLLDVWDALLDKKKAYIKESYGAEATKVGTEALNLLDAEREVTKRLANSRLSSGASMGSHSLQYRMWKGSYKYEGKNWRDVAGSISKELGNVKFDGMSDMLNMTGKQLEWIKTNYTGLWSAMDGDFRGYLDSIIEYGEVEKEILESVKEQITGISFDGFEDSYLNMLSDMSLKNEDFAKDFEKKLQQSILRSMLAKNYSTQIQALYDSWAKAGEDGTYTQEEVEALRKAQSQLTDAMLTEREKMAAAFNWSADDDGKGSSQAGRAGVITTVTEQTAGKLEGIGYSIQTRIISMDDKMTDLSQYAYEAIGILGVIAENTAHCKRLGDMADAIERIDRDGVKLKG